MATNKSIISDITDNIPKIEQQIKPIISGAEQVIDMFHSNSGQTGPIGSTSSPSSSSSPNNIGVTGVTGVTGNNGYQPINNGNTGATGINSNGVTGSQQPTNVNSVLTLNGITVNPANQLDSDNEIEITIDPDNGSKVYNGWTAKNTNTLRNWKASISQASYIYQVVGEKYKKRLNYILVLVLILSTVSTTISAVSSALLAIDSNKYIWATFGINIAIFVISGTITIFNGILGITQWNSFVTTLSTFVEKLDTLYGIVANELVLPDTIRHDAVDFIKNNNANYLNILLQSPDIAPSDYEAANDQYMKFIRDNSNNTQFSQIYYANDAEIELI